MKNILIVDDEEDMKHLFLQKFRKELREGLLKFNFASSADEALSYLRDLSPTDIVLTLSDINMPGRSGIELLQVIKKEFPNLKVIMVSAYNDENHRSMAKKAGADDFFSKPVNFDILKDKVMQEINNRENN